VKVHGLSRRYSTLAKTLLAGWREDLADRIGWLRHRRDPRAIAGRAFDFRRYGWFQVLHRNHFLDMIPTPAMSLCNTDCWLRLSHLTVTPAQSFSITVPRSFLSSRQNTRVPTSNNLDCEPVICCAVSLRSHERPHWLLGAAIAMVVANAFAACAALSTLAALRFRYLPLDP
jgi:hypothetical protein